MSLFFRLREWMKCLGILLPSMMAASAEAGLILDQQSNMADNSSVLTSDDEAAQTFTAGVAGILGRVDIQIAKNGQLTTQPLLFDVRTTVAGLPGEDDNNVLVSRSILAADIPDTSTFLLPPGSDFVSIDVSAAGIVVVPGEMLAITLRTDESRGAYYWNVKARGDPYAGGASFFRVAPVPPTFAGPWQPNGGTDSDQVFETLVDVTGYATAPEPGSLTLLALGLAGIGGYFSRKREGPRSLSSR